MRTTPTPGARRSSTSLCRRHGSDVKRAQGLARKLEWANRSRRGPITLSRRVPRVSRLRAAAGLRSHGQAAIRFTRITTRPLGISPPGAAGVSPRREPWVTCAAQGSTAPSGAAEFNRCLGHVTFVQQTHLSLHLQHEGSKAVHHRGPARSALCLHRWDSEKT